jgi:RimJ/RimL family protein N-acetyltransferase
MLKSTARLVLRLATQADADLLLAWRNDEQTRALSHHTGLVSTEMHANWLGASLADPHRKLYVAMRDTEPVGTVRADFDAAHGAWQLSWTVAPQLRGLGLGQQMVTLAAEQIAEPITAQVKLGNAASARIAQACGMQLQTERDGVMHFYRPGRTG